MLGSMEMEIERRTVGGEPGATHSDELEDSDLSDSQLHTREDELADAEMRPARWIDPDLDDDEDGGQLIGSWRTWLDAPSSARIF
eukprot:SAG22_NODE_132_length_18535_cov_8.178021_9_plen_85_part_00